VVQQPATKSADTAIVDPHARRQALLDEYREAGAYCRNYELLMRTNNLVFMGVFVAMTGLVERSDNVVDAIVFASLGIVASLLFVYVGVRTRHYYRASFMRALEIEPALGFDLLQRGEREVRTLRVPLLGTLTSNHVFLAIQWAAMCYFVVKIFAWLR